VKTSVQNEIRDVVAVARGRKVRWGLGEISSRARPGLERGEGCRAARWHEARSRVLHHRGRTNDAALFLFGRRRWTPACASPSRPSSRSRMPPTSAASGEEVGGALGRDDSSMCDYATANGTGNSRVRASVLQRSRRSARYALPSGLRSASRLVPRGLDCASGRHAVSIENSRWLRNVGACGPTAQ
jgi:hypothetical protein